MNDLISRQAALDLFIGEGMITAAIYIERMPSAQPIDAQCWGCNCPKMKDITRAKNDYEGLVETMHSIIQDLISSQTEIIRCKDCKWNIGDCCCFDTYAASDFSENGFCSSAERRNK